MTVDLKTQLRDYTEFFMSSIDAVEIGEIPGLTTEMDGTLREDREGRGATKTLAPTKERKLRRRQPRYSPRPIVAFVVGLIVILVVTGGVALWVGGGDPDVAPAPTQTTEAPAPTTSTTVPATTAPAAVRAADVGVQIEVDGLPCEIVANESGVWVGGPDLSTFCTLADGQLVFTEPGLSYVRRIDLATNQVAAAVELNGRIVEQAALAGDRLWITAFDHELSSTPPVQHVVAIDTSTDSLLTEWRSSIVSGVDVAVGEGAVWVSGADGYRTTVFRLDQETGQPVTSIPLDQSPPSGTLGIATGAGSVWVLWEGFDGISLDRIDPVTNQVVSTTDLGTASVFWGRSFLEFGEGFVWVVVPAKCECEGRVLKINPETGEIVSETIVGLYPTAVAVGEGFVWIIDFHTFDSTINPEYLDGAATENYELAVIHRVDPATGALAGGPIVFDQRPSDLTVANGTLWVTHPTSRLITRIDVADLP